MTLTVVLWWDAVAVDCAGRPESVAYYAVRGQHVRLLGWTTSDPPSPIYSDQLPQETTTTFAQWPMSTEPLLPGDVAWWEVDAVDMAGNSTEGTCF